jgi:hypothetical protein
MAVLQRINGPLTDRQAQLRERLEAEWEDPQGAEPIIIEESTRQGPAPVHLYVVWQEWSDLSPLERSRIILKAYEHHLGVDNAARVTDVTLAMGLTPDEARKMNIEF